MRQTLWSNGAKKSNFFTPDITQTLFKIRQQTNRMLQFPGLMQRPVASQRSLYCSHIYLGYPSKYLNFTFRIGLSWITGNCGGCLLRSGKKDKNPHLLLDLGWWSLVLFEPSYSTQTKSIRKNYVYRGVSQMKMTRNLRGHSPSR